MQWKKPEFQEINMSAEIGGYQEEEGGRYPQSQPRAEPKGDVTYTGAELSQEARPEIS